MFHIFKLFLCFVFFLGSSTVVRSEAEDQAKLDRYISKTCKHQCVESAVLIMAVKEAAQRTGSDPNMLLAIIKSESGFQDKAPNRSNGRSVGLSQIQVKWHREKFRSRNYYDVFDNVYVGALIYDVCADKWKGSKEKALWCYNGYQKMGMKKYVPKVLANYREVVQLKVI